ncbi:MAG: GNAT family N-acetyltransferase [Acidimicrobiales bacterium]
MPESSRAAQLDDIDELTRLVVEGRDSVADARGGELWLDRHAPRGEPRAHYTEAMISPDRLVQLALIDQVPCGFLNSVVDRSGRRTIAIVEEVYVTEPARGIGLGELLMDAALDWAEANDCVGIDGYALPGDRATKNFFETFGLVARGIVVHRPIG